MNPVTRAFASMAIASVLLVSCSTDFAVPPEAQLGCAAAADCPSGWTCNANIGRCVKTENMDTTAPALTGKAVVTPPLLGRKQVATLTFETSEGLAVPPEVTIDAGQGRMLTQDKVKSSGNKYVFTYTAAGDEPQGKDCPISIMLTDASGNKSGDTSGRSLTFDFTKPGIDKVSIEGSPVMKGGQVKVRFAADETPGKDPSVRVTAKEQFTNDKETSGLNYVYAYTATGAETPDGTELEGHVLIDVQDAAGNALDSYDAGAVTFDFKKPSIAGVPVVSQKVAKAGTAVSVTFTVSEPLGPMPAVMAGGKALTGEKLGELDYKFTYSVEDTDTDGVKKVTVALQDKAGNQAEGVFLPVMLAKVIG